MFDYNALFYHQKATKNRAVYLVTVGKSERFRVGDIAVLRLDQDVYWVLEKMRSTTGAAATVEYNDMREGFIDSFSDAEIVTRQYALDFCKRNSCGRIKVGTRVKWTLAELEAEFGTLEVTNEPVSEAVTEIDREFKWLLGHNCWSHKPVLVYITAGRHKGTYAMMYNSHDLRKKWRAVRATRMTTAGVVIRDTQPSNITGLSETRFRVVDIKTEKFCPVACDTPTGTAQHNRDPESTPVTEVCG